MGLRRDGGDAETGAGMDVGGGLAFTDAVTGLSLDVPVRNLVVHQAEDRSEHHTHRDETKPGRLLDQMLDQVVVER